MCHDDKYGLFEKTPPPILTQKCVANVFDSYRRDESSGFDDGYVFFFRELFYSQKIKNFQVSQLSITRFIGINIFPKRNRYLQLKLSKFN